MKIAIRKENNSLYLDKEIYYNQAFIDYGTDKDGNVDMTFLNKEPYNYTFVEIPDKFKDCEATDFNDDLSFNAEKYNNRINHYKIDELRGKRESECFPIINRGQLWYNTLTEKQLQELNNWYQEWLDVTTTLKEPIKPEWIK